MTIEHHAWEFLNFLYVLLVVVNSSSGHWRLSDWVESKFHVLQYPFNFPRHACSQTSAHKYFWVLHLVLSRRKLSCEQFSSRFSLTTFTTHSSGGLERNDGLDFVCQNLFLRCGQVISVLCILLWSSMSLVIHLPRFHCICNYSCFTGTVLETNCTLFMVEEKTVHGIGNVCLPSVRVCTSHPYNFQSSFCNRVMISCSIHIQQQSMCTLLLYIVCVLLFVCHFFFVWHILPCASPPFVERHHVIRQSRRNNYLRWMSSGGMNIAQFTDLKLLR